MIDYSKSNSFLGSIYDLFEAVYYTDPSKFIQKEIRYGFLHLKKKIETINPDALNIYEKILLKAENYRKNVLEFEDLFDFATFIKCIEKSLFYKNSLESKICCDSRLEEKTTRKLIFNFSEIVIVLELAVLNRVDECITLKVTRDYGRNMCNTYYIKNKELDYVDSNDLVLINSVNILLQNSIADLYIELAEAIYTKKILDRNYIGSFYNITDTLVKENMMENKDV